MTITLPPPPGKLYDVLGRRMHLQVTGHRGSQPAVVMDSGLLGNSLVWTNTLAALAPLTLACAFDRAGYAYSDPAPVGEPRTSQQIVAELRLLLHAADIQPPYILMGHSFGAINILVYAYSYPTEVAGLCLVDPSHPDMFTHAPGVPGPAAVSRGMALFATLSRLGLRRWLGSMAIRSILPGGAQTLPSETWQTLLAIFQRGLEFETARRETAMGIENFAAARGAPGKLGDLLLDILSAGYWVSGKQTRTKQAMQQLHEGMATWSKRGRHLIVSGSDHSDLPVVRADAIAQSVLHLLGQAA